MVVLTLLWHPQMRRPKTRRFSLAKPKAWEACPRPQSSKCVNNTQSPAACQRPSVQIAIGGYFQERQIEAARSYYGRPENAGFCPPGLAKKGTGCLPPGQAKKWRIGTPLPAGVIYYDVPRSVVVTLGVPPSGYKYVRVASDILLIALGTSMVIDAMEDLVR
jgi:hypothetical protein